VSQSKSSIDVWTIPTLILWLVFFVIGLFPEGMFWATRYAGKVVTQNAVINSPSLITVSLSVYLAFFVYLRCVDTGASRENAAARGIQIGILALIAFLPYPFYLLISPGDLTLQGAGVYRFDELIAVFGIVLAVFAGNHRTFLSDCQVESLPQYVPAA